MAPVDTVAGMEPNRRRPKLAVVATVAAVVASYSWIVVVAHRSR